MTDQKAPRSGAVWNWVTRETSPLPRPIAHRPMTMMISSPVSSTQVSTTLAFTLSPTPRKLTIATTAMKTRPIRVMPVARETEAEGGREVGGEGARGGRGRGDAGTHHREGDDEGDEVDAEGLVRVERGTGGLRIFRDQFEIAEGGDQRDDEGHQERQPDHAADLLGDLAGQRIDAGAQNVADDEEQQKPWPHHAMQAGLGRRRGSGRCTSAISPSVQCLSLLEASREL